MRGSSPRMTTRGQHAARRRSKQKSCAPPAAEQKRGPEHIAEQGIVQKRQRPDVAGNEASEIERVDAAERPHRKVRAREEEQRGRDRKRREHDGAARAPPPAENGRSRQSGI